MKNFKTPKCNRRACSGLEGDPEETKEGEENADKSGKNIKDQKDNILDI